MRKKNKESVAIVMGSDSDWPVVENAYQTITSFDVDCQVRVLSAHRTPHETTDFAQNAEKNGIKVIIAAAGGAAHLAGVLAAHTSIPVIGIPIESASLKGLDSLLSTVQMPSGIPVATVAIGKAGAINAALLAIQILAIHDSKLKKKLISHKRQLKSKVAKGNKRIQSQLEATS